MTQEKPSSLAEFAPGAMFIAHCLPRALVLTPAGTAGFFGGASALFRSVRVDTVPMVQVAVETP
jgi:hypothetical protein